jgi:membrane-associated protease RseP (regulator of RpoE activity)
MSSVHSRVNEVNYDLEIVPIMKKLTLWALATCALQVQGQELPKPDAVKRIIIINEKGTQISMDSIRIGIPLNMDSLMTNQLESGTSEQMIMMGVPSDSRPMFGVQIAATEGVKGVTVQSVEMVSTAAALGMRVGDVIAKVNGTSIETPRAMVELVRALKMGDAIEVDYRRDGKPYKVRGFLIPLGLGQGVPSFEGGTGPIRKEIRIERREM